MGGAVQPHFPVADTNVAGVDGGEYQARLANEHGLDLVEIAVGGGDKFRGEGHVVGGTDTIFRCRFLRGGVHGFGGVLAEHGRQGGQGSSGHSVREKCASLDFHRV